MESSEKDIWERSHQKLGVMSGSGSNSGLQLKEVDNDQVAVLGKRALQVLVEERVRQTGHLGVSTLADIPGLIFQVQVAARSFHEVKAGGDEFEIEVAQWLLHHFLQWDQYCALLKDNGNETPAVDETQLSTFAQTAVEQMDAQMRQNKVLSSSKRPLETIAHQYRHSSTGCLGRASRYVQKLGTSLKNIGAATAQGGLLGGSISVLMELSQLKGIAQEKTQVQQKLEATQEQLTDAARTYRQKIQDISTNAERRVQDEKQRIKASVATGDERLHPDFGNKDYKAPANGPSQPKSLASVPPQAPAATKPALSDGERRRPIKGPNPAPN